MAILDLGRMTCLSHSVLLKEEINNKKKKPLHKEWANTLNTTFAHYASSLIGVSLLTE